MKQISRPMIGLMSVVAGAAVTLAAVQLGLGAKETNPPPRLNLHETPVNRQALGVSYAPVIKRVAPSVVNIYSTRIIRERPFELNPLFNDPMFRRFFGPGENGGSQPGRRSRPQKAQGLGSGVIVSADGYILTANHVVEGADEIKVALANSGKEFSAKVIGTDPPTDVAVLKVEATDLPAVGIADSDKLEVGDVVLAIGNPFDVGQTVTMGIVSAVGRTALDINEYENFIQTDAAINPGNSGGALVDAEGRLVGINTAIFSRTGGNQGVGFAVPINLARAVMERLVDFGKVTRGYLGVSLQPAITSEILQDFNLPDPSGALVTGVMPNTPAAQAGLKEGDFIREVNGKKISDRSHLRLMVSQLAPGTKVTLKVLRSEAGKKPVEKTIATTLGTLPEDRGMGRGRIMPHEEAPPREDALEGVEVTDLDPATRRQFNIPGSVQGALVSNVDPDSNSAEAGVRSGDVILEINRLPVRSAEDAVELSDKAKDNRVMLRIWRNGGSIYIPVESSKPKE